jgi:exo-beta-1,3-glucanase (GH17 family)
MPAPAVLRHIAWLLLLCALIVAAWWLPNRLQDPAPGVNADKFNSLTYAAYRPGESPLTDRFATAAEVDEDLALLAPRTRAIRSYAAFEGQYDLPAIARKHGLKLWQGIWLGGDREKNKREMARAIELAHRYPDVIERVIVGNEVLLRRDLPPAELIADIDLVRAAVRQPVAYADVPDFWDQFPAVAQHVDVVLVHALPYWEDVPSGIGQAVARVGAMYSHFQKLFPGRQIAIGETGWPSRGRQRRDAVPSLINQARFLREFIKLSQARHFDYNFIEAFDQNWKYENEGIVGANWGILNADRTPKIPLSGPLREDKGWAWHAAFSIACGLLLCALCAATGRRAVAARDLTLGMVLGAALGIAFADATPVLYDAHVWLAFVVNFAGQTVLAALAMLRRSGAVAAMPERTGADATRRVRDALRLRFSIAGGVFEDACFIFAWTAGVQQILLVFDPRYREFPVWSFAVPLVIAALRLPGLRIGRMRGTEETAVSLTLCAGAIASLVQEGPLNGQSIVWNGCAIILAVSLSSPKVGVSPRPSGIGEERPG